MKKILITGGSGFIGSNLANYYSQNNKVIVFDNYRRGKISSLTKNKNLRIIKGDITNRNQVKKALNKVDTVIHLAYINGTEFFYKYPEKILEIAAKGIINIIECSIEKNIQELYLASSSEVYQNPKIIPTPEEIPLIIPDVLNPRYTYGGGKILTELYGVHYAKYFKKLIIFRPHNVYGPNMGNEHVIPQLLIKANKIKNSKKSLRILGNGNQTRSFIYISDFINSFDLILKKGKNKNIYNIGNEQEISIKNLVKKIKKTVDIKNKVINIDNHKGSPNRRCPDITKLVKLGYKMRIDLNKGLYLTNEWYKSLK
jgi:nucleoside-diphosphate-sugar epimerase